MAYPAVEWHVDSVSWTAMTAWATGVAKAAGALVRQSATPTTGNERVFVCIVAGTTHATTEPTWVVTRGATTTDNTITWQECSGQAAVCGNVSGTPAWTVVKNTAVSLGVIIKNVAATHYFICSSAGTAGNGAEPTWNTTAGVTTADNTVTWTCIGAVGNFTAFQGAAARLQVAFGTNFAAAGATVWIGDDHAETQGSTMTCTSPGTMAAPCFVYCVDHTKSSPGTGDLKTTASITTTGNSTFRLQGSYYIYGVTLSAGSGLNSVGFFTNSAGWHYFDHCVLKSGVTFGGSASFINLGGVYPQLNILDNTSVSFAAVANGMSSPGALTIWKNSTALAAGSSVPTQLFRDAASDPLARWIIDGVDFSGITSGNTLFGVAASVDVDIVNCKLASGVTVFATPSVRAAAPISAIASDSSTAVYRQMVTDYKGALTQETTIVRSGGASDGTTPLSWKIVTTANALWVDPFESFPVAIWNDTTGSSVTATVEIVASGSLNNDDVWLEVEYLGSSSTPIASFINSTKANNLATGSANTASSATWASSPGTAMSLAVTFTPQMKGYIRAVVKVAKASTTLYVDPLIKLS